MAIKPSMHFVLSLLLLHFTAAMAIYLTVLPVTVKSVMILLIVLNLCYFLARDILFFLPHSWREISLEQSGVSITLREGSSMIAEVANTTFINPYFIVLRVRLAGCPPVSRVIFPDALHADEFRELSVRLKFA